MGSRDGERAGGRRPGCALDVGAQDDHAGDEPQSGTGGGAQHATVESIPSLARVARHEVRRVPRRRGLFIAGERTEPAFAGYMEGAVRSGLRAGRWALAPRA